MYLMRTYGRRRNRQPKEIVSTFLVKEIPLFINNNTNNILDIGFGNGEIIMDLAINNKQNYYFGVEVYKNGINKVLKYIYNNNLTNIYIYEKDARDFLNLVNEKFFNKIFIFFPDPWPKKKQQKRRLINKNFLNLVNEKIKNNGEIIFASDHKDYFLNVLEEIKILQYKITNIFHCSSLEAPFSKSKYAIKAKFCHYFIGRKIC